MNRLFARPALLIFLGCVLLFVAVNHAFFLSTPWHEDGDFAVNGLQIERAKHFDELYGNYSRFHFNHPGPAFFYVYALGESLLCDWYQVAPSPHNAHVFAGLLLQSAFFATALGLATRWIRARWFLPIALFLAGWHFSLAGDAFTSIWPPNALLMPFLCFLVACASFAAGRPQDLPVAVVAGGFLVHGHVAQPLFVVVLFFVAYVWFWQSDRTLGEAGWGFLQRHHTVHLLASVCLFCFVLPLAIDLALGSESNLMRIVRFLLLKGNTHKTLGQSFLYLLSFFGYCKDQASFLADPAHLNLGFLRSRLPFYLAWLAVLGGIGTGLRQKWRTISTSPESRFLVVLTGLVALCLGLTLLWGMIQTGEMYAFNGHFYYAIIYTLLLILAALFALRLPERGAFAGGTLLCFAGVALVWKYQQEPQSAQKADHHWMDATEAALSADPHPLQTKFLVFDHDDWGEAAKTALALKRLGGRFRVEGNWGFMFGYYRTFQPSAEENNPPAMSVWHLSRRLLPGRSAPLDRDLRIFFDPSPLDPNGTVIDCSREGNLEQYQFYGFSIADGSFAWTTLPRSALQFSSVPTLHDLVATITAEPFTAGKLIPHQPMTLYINDCPVANFDLRTQQTVSAVIPASIWNLRPVVTVVLRFPSANSPLRLGLSGDPRMLGWAISRISFKPVSP